VWDMSDPMGKGYLEKSGFFVALKLISLAQTKQEMNVANLSAETTAPDLGPVEVMDISTQPAFVANIPWDITLSEKSKYDKVFDSLQPVNNMLGGDKVKPVLMNSKLPVDILGRIWDMSDIDKDGYLDRDEFAVAMHLVYQAREGMETPNVLRPGLVPPSKRKGLGVVAASIPGAVPVLPVPGATPGANWGRSTPTQSMNGSQVPWVVTAAEKANYDVIFNQLDTDHDGLVSGGDIRDIMTQSGLRTNVLAHIWGLCDSQSVGKLTAEQFALAMFLIQQKLKGVEPPVQLTPEMIPPSLRSVADPAAFGVRNGTNAGPYSHVADFSAVKELDHISKEIDDIKKEKLHLERDKSQQEADIKIRQSEVQVLQKELDSLTATLNQLESQKKEAQKRLDELDDKRSTLERNVIELRGETDKELAEVNKMKSLLNNRQLMIKDQETELERLKSQLSQLREEEAKLAEVADSSRQQLEQLASSQGEISSEIYVAKARLQQLHYQYGDDSGFASFPDFTDDSSNGNGNFNRLQIFSNVPPVEEFQVDPFKDEDMFGSGGILPDPQSDPFQNDDPFKEIGDPFKSSDPFGSEDPFKDAFGDTSANVKAGSAFNLSSDPFVDVSQGDKDTNAFDAFGVSWTSGSSFGQSDSKSSSSNDPFGTSPISNLSPAQKRPPPPRPAPIKSRSPISFGSVSPNPSVQPLGGFESDPFGGGDPFNGGGILKSSERNSSADPFANFADFSPGKFVAPDDEDFFGGPSTISIKDSSLAQSQLGRQNIKIGGHKLGFNDSEA
ncbi:unnamed protein product, partial [Candidula unifasciata]